MLKKDFIAEDFQSVVDSLLARNKSIIDIITKLQDTNARYMRALGKAATHCGCISIQAQKQPISEDLDLDEMRNFSQSHIYGELCSDCRNMIETELGSHMFFIASLCNTLGLSLYDIILREQSRLETLGRFSLR